MLSLGRLSSSELGSLFQILLTNIPIYIKLYKCSLIIVLHSSVPIVHHLILFHEPNNNLRKVRIWYSPLCKFNILLSSFYL